MPKSREFSAVPNGEYGPFAQALRDWVIDWQTGVNRFGGKRIALPPQDFFARTIGTDAASFSRWWQGAALPRSEFIPQLAWTFVRHMEDVLAIINIDLGRRDRPPYDTYDDMVEWMKLQGGKLAERGDRLIAVTRSEAWLDAEAIGWKRYVEETLCAPTLSRPSKAAALMQGIDSWLAEKHPGRRQPLAHAQGLTAGSRDDVVAIA